MFGEEDVRLGQGIEKNKRGSRVPATDENYYGFCTPVHLFITAGFVDTNVSKSFNYPSFYN